MKIQNPLNGNSQPTLTVSLTLPVTKYVTVLAGTTVVVKSFVPVTWIEIIVKCIKGSGCKIDSSWVPYQYDSLINPVRYKQEAIFKKASSMIIIIIM